MAVTLRVRPLGRRDSHARPEDDRTSVVVEVRSANDDPVDPLEVLQVGELDASHDLVLADS